jgi:hypothetical protein
MKKKNVLKHLDQVAGFQPFGFHVVNVVLHSVSTFLFVALADVTLPTRTSVVIASAIFATHPVHVEAVAGIVGRAGANLIKPFGVIS